MYGSVIHEFMKVSLVFNLFQGSPDRPVDERHIGPKCRLPILRHRLQRLFNRKIIDTAVQYDIYRLLDPGIGVCGKDGQSVPVGVGQPSLKVDTLTVGGTQL